MQVERIEQFHLGDILSITGDRLVSPDGFAGVQKLTGYLVGGEPFTVTVAILQPTCKAALLKQHPQLSEADDSCVNGENWKQWLDEQIARFGEYLPVRPMHETEQ